jgi:hypothetical protein
MTKGNKTAGYPQPSAIARPTSTWETQLEKRNSATGTRTDVSSVNRALNMIFSPVAENDDIDFDDNFSLPLDRDEIPSESDGELFCDRKKSEASSSLSRDTSHSRMSLSTNTSIQRDDTYEPLANPTPLIDVPNKTPPRPIPRRTPDTPLSPTTSRLASQGTRIVYGINPSTQIQASQEQLPEGSNLQRSQTNTASATNDSLSPQNIGPRSMGRLVSMADGFTNLVKSVYSDPNPPIEHTEKNQTNTTAEEDESENILNSTPLHDNEQHINDTLAQLHENNMTPHNDISRQQPQNDLAMESVHDDVDQLNTSISAVNNDMLTLKTMVNKITNDLPKYQHLSLMATQSKEKIDVYQKHNEEEFKHVKASVVHNQDNFQELHNKFILSEACNFNLRDEIREAKVEINQAFELISQLTEKFDQLQITNPDITQKIERIAALQMDTLIPDNIQQEISQIKHEQRVQKTTMGAEIQQTIDKVQDMMTKIHNLQFDTKALQNKASLMQVTLTNLDRNGSNITDPNIMLNVFFENCTMPFYLKNKSWLLNGLQGPQSDLIL